MLYLLRHLLSVLILPVTMVLLVPVKLEARFGVAYRRYRRQVRRFLPSVRPWTAVD